jgi:hypothetical protein
VEGLFALFFFSFLFFSLQMRNASILAFWENEKRAIKTFGRMCGSQRAASMFVQNAERRKVLKKTSWIRQAVALLQAGEFDRTI